MSQVEVLSLEDMVNVTLNSDRGILVIVYGVSRSTLDQSPNDSRSPIEQWPINFSSIQR